MSTTPDPRATSSATKPKSPDIAALFSAGKAKGKKTEDDVFYYSYNSMSGTDHTLAPGQYLLHAALDGVSSRLEEGGLVWQQYLQPHVGRIGLVLDAVLGEGLDRLLKDAKLTTAPRLAKTIPVLSFRPEDWDDTVPRGFNSFAPDTPEAERKKLYYMLYNTAGRKMAGECHDSSSGLALYGCVSLSTPAYRCEILFDTTGFEWVHASHGHIPTLAVPLSATRTRSPVYMASVTVTTDNGHMIIKPAATVYEIPKEGGLRYKFAKCCCRRETRDVDEYKNSLLGGERRGERMAEKDRYQAIPPNVPKGTFGKIRIGLVNQNDGSPIYGRAR